MDGTIDSLNIELKATTSSARLSINDLITALDRLDAKLGNVKNLDTFRRNIEGVNISMESLATTVGKMDVSKFREIANAFNSISRSSGKLSSAVSSLQFTKVRDEAKGFTREIENTSRTLASEFGIRDKAVISDLERQLTELAKETNNVMNMGGNGSQLQRLYDGISRTLFNNRKTVQGIGVEYDNLVQKINKANVAIDFQKSEFGDMYSKMRNSLGKGWAKDTPSEGAVGMDVWVESLDPADIDLMKRYGYVVGDTTTAFRALYEIKQRWLEVNRSGAAVENEINSSMKGTQQVVQSVIQSFSALSGQLGNVSTIGETQIVDTFKTMSAGIKEFESVNIKSVEQIKTLANAISALGRTGAERAITNIPLLAKSFKEMMTTLSTAPVVSKNVIDVANSLAALASNGRGAMTSMNKLSPSFLQFGNSARRASHSVRGLAGQFGRFYATFWLLIRAFQKLGEAIDLSSQLTEVENVVNQTFSNMRGVLDAMTKDSITKFGMSELAVKKYASRFQAMGAALGITSRQVEQATSMLTHLPDEYGKIGKSIADMSTNLTRLTADMASFYDVAQSDVAEDLEAVFTGMSRPLRTYGIDLTVANLKQFALNNGLNANIESMTQAEKTMLRYMYVMERAQYAMGDFTRTADTWHNQINILKANIQQLAIVIGQGFINALKPLIRGLNAALTSITSFAVKVLNALGQIFGWKYEMNLGGVTSDLEDGALAAEDLEDGLGGASNKAKELKNQLRGFDKLNILNTGNDNTGGGKGSGSAAGGGGGIDDSDVIRAVKTTDGLMHSAIKDLEGLGAYISDAVSTQLEKIDWQKSYEKARNFGKGLADFMNGQFAGDSGKRLFENLGGTIAGALNTALESVNSFAINYKWSEVGTNIASGINEFFKDWKPTLAANTFNNVAGGILDEIIAAIDNVDWNLIGERVGTFLAKIKWTKIVGKMATALAKAIGGIFKGMKVSFKQAPFETAILTAFSALKLTKLGTLITAKLLTKLFGAKGIISLQIKEIALSFAGKIAWEGKTLWAILQNALCAALGVPISAITMTAGIIGVSLAVAAYFTWDSLTVTEGEMRKWVDGWDEFKEKMVEVAEAVDDTKQSIQSLNGSYELDLQQVSYSSEEINKLVDRYYELANKTSLTAEEKENLSNVVSQLISKVPELSTLYDEETGYIKGTREEVDKLVDAQLKELKVEASKAYLTKLYEERYKAIDEMKMAYEEYSKALEYNKEQSLRLFADWRSGKIGYIEYQKSVAKLGEETKKAADNYKAAAENIDTLGNSINSVTQDLYGTTEDLSAYTTAMSEAIKGSADSHDTWLGMAFALTQVGNAANNSGVSAEELKNRITTTSNESSKNLDAFTSSLVKNLSVGTNSVKELGDKVTGLNGQTTLSQAKSNITLFQQNATSNMNLANQSTTAFTGSIDVLKRTSNLSGASNNIATFASASSANMNNVKNTVNGAKDSINQTNTATQNLMKQSGQKFEIKTDTSPLESLKEVLGKVVEGLKSLFDYNGKTVTTYTENVTTTTKKKADGGVFVNGMWKDIAAYAIGGVPTTGQMFIAREAGPELVGTLGGHTAVMNNDQIVASVSNGVYQAVASAMRQYGGTNVDIHLEGDANGIFKVVQAESNSYYRKTGRSPFKS